MRRITRSGAAVHHAAPADVQRFAKGIVHHVITDDDVVAGRRVGRTALVRAVRGGHQQDARPIARAGSVFALAVLHDPVVAADGNLLAPARGGHMQTVQGDVAVFAVGIVLSRQIPYSALGASGIGDPVGRRIAAVVLAVAVQRQNATAGVRSHAQIDAVLGPVAVVVVNVVAVRRSIAG